jgi:predicted RNase H-like nuclease (RuvC/YqgF family)
MAELTKAELQQKLLELEQKNEELSKANEELEQKVAALIEAGGSSELDEQIAFKKDQLAELEAEIAAKQAPKEPIKPKINSVDGYTLRKPVYLGGKFGTVTAEKLNAESLAAIREASGEKYLIKL